MASHEKASKSVEDLTIRSPPSTTSTSPVQEQPAPSPPPCTPSDNAATAPEDVNKQDSCAPTPGALEHLVQELATLSNHASMDQIITVQQNILQSLVHSRERLAQLHSMAGDNIDEACKELDRGAELLRVLWKDLEHIWRTLRNIKTALGTHQHKESSG